MEIYSQNNSNWVSGKLHINYLLSRLSISESKICRLNNNLYPICNIDISNKEIQENWRYKR